MQMVNHKRIAKNTLLLYLRMALIMLIGLVASRVVLSSLGAVDFGLYNVIGGIVVALSFMSGAMNASCNRYYSMALGKEDQPLLHEVFKANLLIYAIFCLAVLVICETLGLWLLNAKLVIPVERMGAARWVYQFSIVTFVSGLLTAHDIIEQLKALSGPRSGILIPEPALRSGEDIFLDDVSLTAMREEFPASRIEPVQTGGDYYRALLDWPHYAKRRAGETAYMWQSNAGYTKNIQY